MLREPQREYLEGFIRHSTLEQCSVLLEILRAHVQNVEEAPRSSDEWPADIIDSEAHKFIIEVRDSIRNAIT